MTFSSGPVRISEENALFHPLYASVKNPPKAIWLEGTDRARELIARLPEDGLAVVGTRAPDPRATYFLQSVIGKLRGTNAIVISGLARGIDTHAHEAALAAGLPTIAVLGCGIHQTYPPENARLRRRILAADGLILSEFEPNTLPHPGCFIQRNRLIAGYSKATWIVQSGFRSGALNTAAWAAKHERNVYVTPAFPGDPAFLGNVMLLARGRTKPVWNASAFTEEWLVYFSAIEKNSATPASNFRLDLLLEVERGYREGKDLFGILEERSLRTGESIEGLIGEIETRARSS